MPPSFSPINFVQTEIYLFTACFAFLVVIVTTPFVKAIALRSGRVDLPSQRKVHCTPIPRVGGVTIFFATSLALLLTYCLGGLANVSPLALSSFTIVLLGGIGFFLIGFSDDLVSLSPLMRLVLQIAIAGIVWAAGVRIDASNWLSFGLAGAFPSFIPFQWDWLSLPLTVFWIVGTVNAFNWMDGLDGLAAGVGGIAAVVITVICWHTGQLPTALIGIALLGSLLGFLVFNFDPAQIFMGDGGSYFIGFLLASISITGFAESTFLENTPAMAVLLPLLVLAIPLGDMTLVILARLRQGVSPFLADQRHLHHRLLQIGLPHRLTVLTLYTLTFWTSSLALMWVGVPYSSLLLGSATALVVIMGCKAWYFTRQSVAGVAVFEPSLSQSLDG